jgi:nitrogen regulatory protein PII
MTVGTAKLLTIVAERALEPILVDEIRSAGVGGYTVFDARGAGAHGERAGDWDENRNVCLLVVCDETRLERIAERIAEAYTQDWAIALWISDVEVFRPDKYGS